MRAKNEDENENGATLPNNDMSHEKLELRASKSDGPKEGNEYSNEYVLNFAFVSFVLFTALQFVFALVARSQSMLTDCSAMTVDCVSYLINCWAERMKHSTSNNKEEHDNNGHDSERLSSWERRYRKKMKLLILELAPPLLSVATLIAVTVLAIRTAIEVIVKTDPNDKVATPNLGLMLLFRALNGVLDAVNVLCFAKAEQGALSKGITSVIHPNDYVCEQQQQHQQQHDKRCHKRKNNDGEATLINESTHLLAASIDNNAMLTGTLALGKGSATDATADSDMEDASSSSDADQSGLNLNMCSAWTHICADTLRSIAVLLAAGIASLFPQHLSPADADSYGAIVVSIIIIISLGPLIEGLYFTAWEIYFLRREHTQRQKHTGNPEESVMALSV